MKNVNSTYLKEILGHEISTLNLSDANDDKWAGITTLPIDTCWADESIGRREIYIVSGSVLESGAEYPSGTYLSRGLVNGLRGGADGASLFVYKDSHSTHEGDETVLPNMLQWQPGREDGMQVAYLPSTRSRLMLVSWQPGTTAHMHRHPGGEEIYVLKGVLKDIHGEYGRGTWQRLGVGSQHAPYAEEDTLILLRNGHLV